jgi:hypothetical protein
MLECLVVSLALFRLVEPLQGTPAIRVSCRPVSGWEKNPIHPVRGSNHLRYEIRGELLRLLTNMSLTSVCEETPVALMQKFYFSLTWGLGLKDDLVKVTHDFPDQTTRYWRTWVKNCSVPLLHQQEVIRSALAGGQSGGPDNKSPGATGRRSKLGLPLLLAARCLFCAHGVA